MTGRESILKAITANKPALIPVPEIKLDTSVVTGSDLLQQFIKTLESIGGEAIKTNGYDAIQASINHADTAGKYMVNTISEAGKLNYEIHAGADAQMLESIDTAYIKGTLAVAENGAVWVKESQLANRLVPFICQHLVLVVGVADIVPTMHEAYQKINIAEEGYGVFIAGPSKTADIEQSLVIGAHGARSLVVYLLS